jgi:hypothetical protein
LGVKILPEDREKPPPTQYPEIQPSLSGCLCSQKHAGSGHAQGRREGHQVRKADRPARVSLEKEKPIQRLLRGGTGINKAAAPVGVGTATVQRVRLQCALSKGRPRRDAAKNETCAVGLRRIRGESADPRGFNSWA